MLETETLKIDPEKTANQLEDFVCSYVNKLKRDGIILGLSGGVDSSVLASLAVRALGRDKVLALIMPEKDTDPQSARDARLVARKLGVKTKQVDLTPLLDDFGAYKLNPARLFPRGLRATAVRTYYRVLRRFGRDSFAESLLGTRSRLSRHGLAYSRIKHRLRMVTLYYYAELHNLLVAGAANKSEALTGYFVKFGVDSATDIMPLLGRYKTQVWQLAEYLKVPRQIIDKAPSPDILPGIKDEDVLGSYRTLDIVLVGLEKGLSVSDIARQLKIEKGEVKHIALMKEASRHMRESPYVARVS